MIYEHNLNPVKNIKTFSHRGHSICKKKALPCVLLFLSWQPHTVLDVDQKQRVKTKSKAEKSSLVSLLTLYFWDNVMSYGRIVQYEGSKHSRKMVGVCKTP